MKGKKHKAMKPKKIDQKIIDIGDKTGSDHLYDGKKESGRGSVMRTARLSRKPEK